MIINDYLGLIGFSGLSLGLGFAVISLLANGYFLMKNDLTIGWISRTIILVQFICLALAVFSLGGLLLNNAFEYPLVFDSVEKSMPWIQKLSGLWSGQSSSLLFWSFILSLVIILVSGFSKRMINEQFSALVSTILGIALVFFLVPVLVLSNPFEKLWQLANGSTVLTIFAPENAGLIVPVDGVGMNPSLRHIAMLLHPPFLYLGLVGFFVPYAVALAALIRGDREKKWVNLLMPVTLAAWICLTLGMFLGSWWAYTILGWGGYWGWDAVEIAGLLPWLLSFGLIHSLRMQMAGKGYLRWIVLLSGLIFVTILSGILITRSGILKSVHAYSAGVMGPVLSVFIGLNLVVFAFYMTKCWQILKNDANQNRFSTLDLLTDIFNYLILALVFLFFFGQTFPLTSQLVTGAQISWKPEQYELYSAPLLFLLLLTTAICPVSNLFEKDRKMFWQKIIIMLTLSLIPPVILAFRNEIGLIELLGFLAAIFLIVSWTDLIMSQAIVPLFKKDGYAKRKDRFTNFGSNLIHIGLGLMVLGIMGQETLSKTYDLRIAKGEIVSLGDFQIIIQDSRRFISPERTTISATELSITENDQKSFLLSPYLELYPKTEMVYARPAIATNLQRDVQIILSNWQNETDSKLDIHVSVNPLMIWIWIGGMVMVFGGAIALFTSRKNDIDNKKGYNN